MYNLNQILPVLLLLLLATSSLHCNAPKHIAQHNNTKAMNIQGHRGCRGLIPENTIPAMLKALALGVTTLEMDIVITQDNKVILSHEPYFNHEITTLPQGSYIAEADEKNYNLYHMTYDSIQRYDVGLKPHPRFAQQAKQAATKPTLAQLIQAVQAYCAQHHKPLPYFNIETKCTPATDDVYHPKPAIMVNLLMQVVAQYNIQSHVTIQSFDYRTLELVHTKYPSIATAMLVEDGTSTTIQQQLQLLSYTPNIYSPHYSLATTANITYCHSLGIQVIPYTVNDATTIKALIAQGVDGIITDYPNLVPAQYLH